MTRYEENRMLVDEMIKRAESLPTGTYEEMVAFQLGAIATILTDISKSLAILGEVEHESTSPCDSCRFNPPGYGDGKPCTMCPAERR